MELTTHQAAQQLGVTQRQVQRMLANGTLTATRQVGRSVLLDATSVNRILNHDRHQGRPWTSDRIWAVLWRLSGLRTPWVTSVRRLHNVTIETLSWNCRHRASTTTYRASESFLSEIAHHIRVTGVSGLEPARDLMHPQENRIEGYATLMEQETLIGDFCLIPDASGNVVLRVTDHPAVVNWSGVMPDAVVAVDLMDSNNPRESEAGRQLLAELSR